MYNCLDKRYLKRYWWIMTSGNPLISRFADPLNRFVARWDLFLLTVIAIFFTRCLISAYSGADFLDIPVHLVLREGFSGREALDTEVRFEYPPLHAYFQAFWLWLLGDNPLQRKCPH